MATRTGPGISTFSLAPYLHQLQQVTGAEMAFGGLAADAQAPVVLNTFVGARSDGLRDLRLTEGFGLGGKVVATGRPLHVRDYQSARGITHHYDRAVRSEQLCTILAVPVRSPSGMHGVIYAGMRRPTDLGQRTLDRAVTVARGIQQDIAVRTEVARRMSECATTATAAQQRLRDVHAELALIRNGASGQTRLLIEDLMLRLSGGDDLVPLCGIPRHADSPRLSTRELDVITQAGAGLRNVDIAAELGIGEGTVKAYLHSATRKLGVRNRVEAVLAARRLGLIP